MKIITSTVDGGAVVLELPDGAPLRRVQAAASDTAGTRRREATDETQYPADWLPKATRATRRSRRRG